MRNALGVLAVASACALPACAAPDQVTTATLQLAALPSCELMPATQLALRASGDFPAVPETLALHAGTSITLDQFPRDTEYLAFEIGILQRRAGGLAPLGGGSLDRSVLLLPYAASCPLGDPEAAAVRGAVLAPLPDGGLLIAGGCSAPGTAPPATQGDATLPSCTATGGEPLDTAEWIDVTRGTSSALQHLQVARVRPRVLVLDSGTVLVALGWDKHAQIVREVERFDAHAHRFSPITPVLPSHASAAVAALEGDRVLYLGCDGANADCELELLLPDGDDFVSESVHVADPSPEIALRDLERLQLLALHDGRVLVTGRSASAPTQRRGAILDLRDSSLAPAVLTRVPDHLFELADGTRVEADTAGISLSRGDAQSPLDDPPARNLLADLALDFAPHWLPDGDRLHASAAARADLPWLRFADVRVELELDSNGQGAVLLEPPAAAAIAVEVRAKQIALGSCAVARDTGKELVVERHATSVTLRSGDHHARCEAPTLDARVGIAITAAQDTLVRSLRVTRL
jgi:hypothetical protein